MSLENGVSVVTYIARKKHEIVSSTPSRSSSKVKSKFMVTRWKSLAAAALEWLAVTKSRLEFKTAMYRSKQVTAG